MPLPCESPFANKECTKQAFVRVRIGKIKWDVCPSCHTKHFADYPTTDISVAERLGPRDPVIDAVRADLLQRSQFGLKKYGVGLDRTDLNLRQWLQHAYDETLDQANYLKRAIMEIDGNAPKPE
jgi:hypothetical protein